MENVAEEGRADFQRTLGRLYGEGIFVNMHIRLSQEPNSDSLVSDRAFYDISYASNLPGRVLQKVSFRGRMCRLPLSGPLARGFCLSQVRRLGRIPDCSSKNCRVLQSRVPSSNQHHCRNNPSSDQAEPAHMVLGSVLDNQSDSQHFCQAVSGTDGSQEIRDSFHASSQAEVGLGCARTRSAPG